MSGGLQQWLELVEEALRAARPAVPPGVVAAVVAYLGGDVAEAAPLLGRLHGNEPVADAFGPRIRYLSLGGGVFTPYREPHEDRSLPDVYAGMDTLPLDVVRRWVVLVEMLHAPERALCHLTFPQAATWPELLLAHADRLAGAIGADRTAPGRLSHTTLDALQAAAGWDPATLVAAALATPAGEYTWSPRRAALVSALPGYPQALQRHLGAVRAALTPPARHTAPTALVAALDLLSPARPATLAALAPQLADLATSGTRPVREAAAGLLARAGTPGAKALDVVAVEAAPSQRARAVELLVTHADTTGDAALRAAVLERAARDRSASVRAVAARQDTTPAPADPDPGPALPPWSVELTPAVLRWLDDVRGRSAAPPGYAEYPPAPVWPGEDLLTFLTSPECDTPTTAPIRLGPPDPMDRPTDRRAWAVGQALAAADPDGVPVTAALKVVVHLGVPLTDGARLARPVVGLLEAWHERTGHPDLLTAARLLCDLGVPASAVALHWATKGPFALGGDWPDDDVVPLLADQAPWLVEEMRTQRSGDWMHDRSRLFLAAAKLPAPPPGLVDLLFDLSLGAAKGDREHARSALGHRPGLDERLVAALADRRSAVRAAAADWLGRRRCTAAAGPVRRALAAEQHDTAHAALLGALELLGDGPGGEGPGGEGPGEGGVQDVRLDLAARAAKEASAPLPAAARWLRIEDLPAVRWSGTEEPVGPAVLRLLAARAVKGRSPEPDALLRSHVAALDARDRASLGAAVLDAWLRADAEGPALPAKGLLALAAACGGSHVVEAARRYIETNYGYAPGQGRALIAMLGWTDDPGAVQVLLALRRRFRTRSFQEEAARQIDALADRKGWTVDELADRTMPTAGLDDDGTLLLSYGPRSFVAVLTSDLTLALRDAHHEPVRALPPPRAGDDEAAATAARRALATARKELKAVVRGQRDRLLEAMCTGRTWSLADWQSHLAQHPIGRRLVERLVWIATCPSCGPVAFRPDDGTPLAADGTPVDLPQEATVVLAHDLRLPDGSTWQQHLTAEDIAPLFPQFGRGVGPLDPALAGQDTLSEVAGAAVGYFRLRAEATRAGWTRGPNDDGAWFTTYTRRFPSAGITAVLHFSGTELPEQDVEVTLEGLRFERDARRFLPFAEVPDVLLAECRADVLTIAGRHGAALGVA